MPTVTLTSLRLPSSVLKRAKNLARKKGQTLSGMITVLLEDRLKQEEAAAAP